MGSLVGYFDHFIGLDFASIWPGVAFRQAEQKIIFLHFPRRIVRYCIRRLFLLLKIDTDRTRRCSQPLSASLLGLRGPLTGS